MQIFKNTSLSVLTIPAFDDNYIWLIHNNLYAAVIDPGDAIPVLNTLKNHNLTLSAILLTHHHIDHVGGVSDILQYFNVPVYGPADASIISITQPLKENDLIYIVTLRLELKVISVPGHTLRDIAYFVPSEGWLFSGDTLFSGGCGRLFEGTPEQMTYSLAKLAMLPDDTKVFCAHEYTLSNLRFAREIEPNNIALTIRFSITKYKLKQRQPTIPSTLSIEKKTNPFLRYTCPAIIACLKKTGRIPYNFSIEEQN